MNTGEHETDDVEVSFHDHQTLGLPNRLLRPVQPVKEIPLREDLGFGGIEVLGPPREVAEDAAAKTGDVTRDVEDRKHQTVAKPRRQFGPVLALHEQARGGLARIIEPEIRQVLAHRTTVARRVSEPKTVGVGAADRPRRKVLARGSAGG